MVFLLGSESHPNGTTVVQYDNGPADRINLITLTANAHITTAIPADELFGHTLAEVRPPTSRQRST